ncbi:protein TonB [Sphingomonas guangdongensis]|uniref:Protein TonB n=1 Tax=Sphingomonas guangdongensis TaxID=1141890 RepID=A0A285R027_9SPHN|nr:hypothetical protein [Sphingomonas guangdongensis]SOB87194.1 protein TonB [Sphingomonas guangdongensis]
MSAAYQSSSYRPAGSIGSRAGAILLSAILLLLLLLALLWLGAGLREPGDPGRALATFDVASGEKAEISARRTEQPRRVTERRPQPERPRPAPVAPPPPVEPPVALPDFMRMSRSDFAATDIGRIARDPGAASGTTLADVGGGNSTPGEPGAAPGGETLYPAEWYREPTRAELATYMPPRTTEGWGMIVCRTIDRFHVEDCRELGESPGSGLARMMRQAAWQFLVRPPTVNGKPKTGTWVRIRFDIRRAAG